MNGIFKLVIFGRGIEFGRYYCGGAPARVVPKWKDGYFLGVEEHPAVPVSWSWGFGIHWRSPAKSDEMNQGHWWWRCRYWYGKEHRVQTVAEYILAKSYLDGVAEVMNREWNQ